MWNGAGRRLAGVGAAGLVLLLTSWVTPAGAAPKRPTTTAPPAPKGWVVDRVRFEPLSPGTAVGVDGIGSYRGAIEVRATGNRLAVINDVGIEEYLKGIAEVPASWPAEALRAQVIAARTYALYERAARVNTATKAAGADICATDACQVYTGLAREAQPNAAAWSEAVQATAGQVVLYQGAPILAKYSSSNGGTTVPGGQPYLRATADPDDAYSPLHQWRAVLPATQVAAVLGIPGTITGAVRQDDSVVLITWIAADGSTSETSIMAADLRSRLNAGLPAPAGLPRPVPSGRFSVAAGNDAFVVDGRGWGHGIGLSQYGALGKAMRGMRAPDIIAAYYAGLRPTALAPQQLPATLRVAIGLDRPSAGVVGGGFFKVLGPDGAPLAVAASGRWQVLPAAGGRLQVLPPTDQTGGPAVSTPALDPATPVRVGAAPRVGFTLSAPGLLKVTIQHRPPVPAAAAPTMPAALADPAAAAPPGPATTVFEQLVGAGPVALPLPVLAGPGRYEVRVTADTGGGRVTAADLAFDVPPEQGAGAGATTEEAIEGAQPASRRSTKGPGTVAGVLLGFVACAIGAFGLEGRSRLH